jgi:hypothetical protein
MNATEIRLSSEEASMNKEYNTERYTNIYAQLVSEYANLVPQVESPIALSRLLRVYYHAIDTIRDNALDDMEQALDKLYDIDS